MGRLATALRLHVVYAKGVQVRALAPILRRGMISRSNVETSPDARINAMEPGLAGRLHQERLVELVVRLAVRTYLFPAQGNVHRRLWEWYAMELPSVAVQVRLHL